eukprot:Clim_evm43s198 gene=Clim_evmTU43s198
MSTTPAAHTTLATSAKGGIEPHFVRSVEQLKEVELHAKGLETTCKKQYDRYAEFERNNEEALRALNALPLYVAKLQRLSKKMTQLHQRGRDLRLREQQLQNSRKG